MKIIYRKESLKDLNVDLFEELNLFSESVHSEFYFRKRKTYSLLFTQYFEGIICPSTFILKLAALEKQNKKESKFILKDFEILSYFSFEFTSLEFAFLIKSTQNAYTKTSKNGFVLKKNIREKNFNLVIKMNYSAIEKFLKNEI